MTEMDSVLQDKKECYVCKATQNLHSHHIFYGTANRKKSEQYGMKVWLCGTHHNLSNEGVHFNKKLDLQLKKLGQMYMITHGMTLDYFIREFGRSWL